MHGTNPLSLQGSPSQNSCLIMWTWVYISFESSSLLSQNDALRSNKEKGATLTIRYPPGSIPPLTPQTNPASVPD